MYLRSIAVQGFKTFARRTELPFGRGITAIVGPNGSGKSNLVDGVRWALGERNARGLRGQRMEDVIYSGGPGKSAVGMAEVTLSVDNTDRRLPTEFAEVEITRRLYRSGESEYFVNGARARLRDIDALLASTGLRQDGYAVVAQNDIDFVIQATPEMRRQLIEEAAGVRRLRDQREEASRRLDDAQRDMQRARDVLAELQPRVEELRVQAAAAEDYRAVEKQLRSLQGSLARDAWRKARVQLRRAESREQTARVKRDTAAQALAGFEPQYAKHREDLTNAREARFAHQQALAELRLRLAESEHRVRIADERAEAVARALQAARRELTRLAESARAGGQVVEELNRALEAAAATSLNAARTVESARSHQRQTEEVLAQLEADRSDAQQARQQAHRERLACEYDTRQLEGRIQFLAEQRDQAASERARWEECIRGLRSDSDRLVAKLNDLEADKNEKAALVATLEGRLADATSELGSAERAATACSSRIQALEAEVGALRLLRDRAQSPSPITSSPDLRLRRLLELIQVESRYRPAVEAVLEGCLHGWVAAEERSAERAIALVRGSATTRETVLVDPKGVRSEALPRHLKSVRALVNAPRELEPLLSHLLSGVALVDDLAEARRLSAQHPELQLVTLAGELTTPFSYRGGRGPDASLQVQAQVRETESALTEAQRDLSGARAQLEERMAAQAALRAERAAAAAQLETVRAAHTQVTAATAAARAQLEREEQQGQLMHERSEKLVALLDEVQKQQTETSQRLSAASAAEAALEADLPDLDQRLQAAAATVAQAVRLRQDAELKVALAEQRQDDLTRQADRAAKVWHDHGDELGQRGAAADELSRQPAVLQADRSNWLAAVEEQRAELARLEQARLPDRETVQSLEEQLREDEQRNVAVRVQLAQAEDGVAAAQVDVESAKAELERCTAALRGDEAVDEDDPLLTEVDWQKTEREVNRLQRRLDAIGAVNLLAPEEYAQVRDRCEGLLSQLGDLETAASQLLELRQRLEHEIDSRFRTVFQAVAANFQEFFQELFQGGRATLRMETQPDANPLDDGVDILAQTPGKRLQALTLLSGGERALTALAFLFALQAVNPSPFYVLDEVDAALDDANVIRFNRVLQRLAQSQQFVIVTHNHSTMAKAEVLYGVTLGDHGISRMVSVRLEEAKAMPRLSERTA